MRVTSRTGSTRKFVWEFGENKSRVLDAKREWSILELAGARRTCARWGPLELGAKWIRQHRRCVSPPYVETFNSKLIKRFRTWTRSSYVFLRFLFFIYSIVMNITCLFCTWPYSYIWLRNIDIFGARTWAYRSWYGLRLGYHGSTKTIREAAKNKEESISERLVQAIEGEREKTQGHGK